MENLKKEKEILNCKNYIPVIKDKKYNIKKYKLSLLIIYIFIILMLFLKLIA